MDYTAMTFLVILLVMAGFVAMVTVPLVIVSRAIRFIGVSFKKTYNKIRHT